jgi:hypothetical protein
MISDEVDISQNFSGVEEFLNDLEFEHALKL